MAFDTADEKTPLLPTTMAKVQVVDVAQQPTRPEQRREAIETTLQDFNLVLSIFQFFTLCAFYNTHPPYRNRYFELFSLLSHGLFTSMPIAAVTAIIPFIAIPYMLQPENRRLAKDVVVCCYLTSTLLGALLVSISR